MIGLAVYDAANAVPQVADLDGSKERRWQDRMSEPGGASFTMRNADADNAECQRGRVVRCSIDGTVEWAMLIEGYTRRSVAPGEASQQVTVYRGRGTMARWEDFVVYPEGGLGGTLLGDMRYFNFASAYFDDSGWANVDAVDLDTAEQTTPARWPAAADAAKKIRPGGSPTVDHDPETFGVRFGFGTTGGDKMYRLFFTGDDGVDIFINGVSVVSEVRPRMWQETRQVDVRLRDSESHLIGIMGTNIDFAGENYSWVAAAMFELVEGGTELGDLLWTTQDTWVGAQFGATPPGFTAHQVLEILLDEAQARGAVPELTLGGTTTEDVDGTDWPVAPDVAFRIGLDGLGVLRQLAETYIDCAMDPTSMRLDLWVHGGKGTASGVTLAAGTNLLDAIHDVPKAGAGALLTRWAEGWLETVDAGLVAADRRESFLAQGTADSTAEATRVATALIARDGHPSQGLTVAVRRGAGADPYVDYTTGDSLTAPDADGDPATWRNLAFTVQEDPHGKVSVAPELVLVP